MTPSQPSLPEEFARQLLRLFPEQARKLVAQEQARQRLEQGLWAPFPGPQTLAINSPADEVFFGGSAGGGKTDYALGLSVTAHYRTLFLRREAVQLTAVVDRLKSIVGKAGQWRGLGYGGTMRLGERVIELGGCEHEDDRNKYQGRPHDLKVFDEGPHFTRSQFRFISGWNRTDRPGQRCRVLVTGNPPTTPEGRWIVEEWAPWLDTQYPDPAAPGELRWYTYLDGQLRWFKTGETITHRGETITPRSRTFIPARVTDNPVYMQTGYMATLQALPEPLRSQMLYGDFSAGVEDDAWQVIPTSWVRAAQARWTADGHAGQGVTCLGVDPARGGGDRTAIARRHGTWYAPMLKRPGSGTPDGQAVLVLIRQALAQAGDGADTATIHVDVIGIGASVFDLARQEKIKVNAVDFREGVSKRDRSRTMTFANLRAYCYWSFREALDPDRGDNLALPPDPELLADLTAPRWKHLASGVQIESKEDIIKRLGRSPDLGDATVMAALAPRAVWRAESF